MVRWCDLWQHQSVSVVAFGARVMDAEAPGVDRVVERHPADSAGWLLTVPD